MGFFFSRSIWLFDCILTRVTGCQELFGVISDFTIPANLFGNCEFEVEMACAVGGRRRYGAVAASCGSRSHSIVLDIDG